MKKTALIIFFSLMSIFTVKGFVINPLYVNDVAPYIFVGPMVVEYAIDGDEETVRLLEPFAANGILHFVGRALPVSRGTFGHVFEFDLDFLEDEPRILAQFHGILGGHFTADHFVYGILVAGFAQRGRITITRVFFTDEAADRWLDTVRLAF